MRERRTILPAPTDRRHQMRGKRAFFVAAETSIGNIVLQANPKCRAADLSTAGVAHPTQTPAVGKSCSTRAVLQFRSDKKGATGAPSRTPTQTTYRRNARCVQAHPKTRAARAFHAAFDLSPASLFVIRAFLQAISLSPHRTRAFRAFRVMLEQARHPRRTRLAHRRRLRGMRHAGHCPVHALQEPTNRGRMASDRSRQLGRPIPGPLRRREQVQPPLCKVEGDRRRARTAQCARDGIGKHRERRIRRRDDEIPARIGKRPVPLYRADRPPDVPWIATHLPRSGQRLPLEGANSVRLVANRSCPERAEDLRERAQCPLRSDACEQMHVVGHQRAGDDVEMRNEARPEIGTRPSPSQRPRTIRGSGDQVQQLEAGFRRRSHARTSLIRMPPSCRRKHGLASMRNAYVFQPTRAKAPGARGELERRNA